MSLPFQFEIMPGSTMKVTKDTVTINGLDYRGDTVQLKDADPNELQLLIEKMPASIKGKSVKKKNVKTLFGFGFGIKRYMAEPLYIFIETGRSRLIW